MEAMDDVAQVSGVEPWLLWAGGKRSLAPQLVAEIMATRPNFYIEPFLGGGAVALALPYQLRKLLADVNHHLIDCFLCMSHMGGTLLAELREVERHYGDDKNGYLQARDVFNSMVTHPRKMWARRSAFFIYLNARCFNGLWRANRKGFFNVPFGEREKPRRIEVEQLDGYARALMNCTLSSENFAVVLGKEFTRRVNTFKNPLSMFKGTAVYADPPYAGTFDGYAKDGFSEQDQRVLASVLGSYATAGAAVWTTNMDTPLVREIYDGCFSIEEISEQHNVGATGDRRGKRRCVLIRGGAAR